MTSILKATNLFANVVSSGLSDALVIGADQSFYVLLWINLAAHLFAFSLIFLAIKPIIKQTNINQYYKEDQEKLLSNDEKHIIFTDTTSEISSGSTINTTSTSSSSFSTKCRLFYKDILSLKVVLQVPRLFLLVTSWIIGNSIYTVSFN